MADLLKQLSSYNLFNYLLPGVIFAAIADQYLNILLLQDDIIVSFFLYYFLGLVISRVGSLVLEPVLKAWNFLNFAHYPDFVKASQKDDVIDVLSETNNMYRTIFSTLLCLGLIFVYQLLSASCSWLKQVQPFVLFLVLLIIFAFSWRKQTAYISKRVKATIESDICKDGEKTKDGKIDNS